MPGDESLSGLVYQQRYAHYRVLNQLAVDVTRISGGSPELARFIVEGRSGDGGPIWDIVFQFRDGALDLHECKDTQIAKEDRLTFYDRLRREVAAGTPAALIHPVWVTDPEKQTPNGLKLLESLPQNVETSDLTILPISMPARADTESRMLQEAIWRLCHFEREEPADSEAKKKAAAPNAKFGWPRACTFEEAKTLLRNLRVARHRFAELNQSIKLLSTGVFTSGTPDSTQAFVTGILTERVIEVGRAEFSVTEFVQAIGTATIEHNLTGLLRDLMTFSAASGLTAQSGRIVWRNLPGDVATSWSLHERAPTYERTRSECFVADMGVGKTVASQLAFQDEATQRRPSRTLRVEARLLDSQRVDALLRLSCMLCGVGPTWLAIDGLDEIPSGLSQQWGQVLATLIAIPGLTILVTVRREVLATQDWLNTAVASLHRVDIEPLSIEQVEQAFSDVGLPVPKNRQLVRVLQNPFLLSLYADIVTTTDMPLAESGEVTAFRVIEEFWKRRVRGASTGQRAVGNSETSQEAKRKAVLFLGEQTIDGKLALSRDGADSELSRGIEILLLEGVVKEQGAAAVSWNHAWLREYSLIQTLLARINRPTAILIARGILSACAEDHVARSASAAGLKAIMANPSLGTTKDYLNELGKLNPGLAREALLVLLEGTATEGALSGLPEELLADALTLAVTLKVPHWKAEVAALDEAVFLGPLGDRMHGAAVQYELVVCRTTTTVDAVQRLVKRDVTRWKAKRPCSTLTLRTLLEAILSWKAFGIADVDEWLIWVAGNSNENSFRYFLEGITELLAQGATDLGCRVFRAILGMDDAERGSTVAAALTSRRLHFQRNLLKVLETHDLLLNLESWGRTAIELLAALVEAKQREGWASRVRIAEQVGEDTEDRFEPRYDEEPRVTTFGDRNHEDVLVRIRKTLEQAFAQLSARPHGAPFQTLMEHTLAARYAAVTVIPLFSLLDAGMSAETRRDWHDAMKLQLLLDDDVANCWSLSDVRRLIRRQLVADSDHTDLELVNAIRGSSLPPQIKVRELSDLVDSGLLTDDERKLIEVAKTSNQLYGPVDFRAQPSITVGRRGAEQSRHDSGWPYPEDAEWIELLNVFIKTEPSNAGAKTSSILELAKPREALITVLSRPEARTEQWLGTVLGWCTEFVRALKSHGESALAELSEPLGPVSWESLLNQHAPWWRETAEVTISSLLKPQPRSHSEKDLEGHLFWNSNDVFWSSIGYLDCLLAITAEPPFAELQARFITGITDRWTSWTPFSKVTLLYWLRTWYFVTFGELRTVLTEVIRTEPDATVVQYAAEHVLKIAKSRPAPELADLMLRVRPGGYDESLSDLAELLGSARIIQTQPDCGEVIKELVALLDSALDCEWPDSQALDCFLGGLVSGARETMDNISDKTEDVYQAWRHLIQQVVERWPFTSEASTDREGRFPLHAICSIVEAERYSDVRTDLFLKLVPVFETLLQRGALSTYCDLHFALKELISGTRTPISGQGEWLPGVVVNEETERALAKLCRRSMERVVSWNEAGTQTNDWGWASCLRGEDTVELIDRCMAAAVDRESFKQTVLPLVDLLAEAGEPERAADLLVRLRKF